MTPFRLSSRPKSTQRRAILSPREATSAGCWVLSAELSCWMLYIADLSPCPPLLGVYFLSRLALGQPATPLARCAPSILLHPIRTCLSASAWWPRRCARLAGGEL